MGGLLALGPSKHFSDSLFIPHSPHLSQLFFILTKPSYLYINNEFILLHKFLHTNLNLKSNLDLSFFWTQLSSVYGIPHPYIIYLIHSTHIL